MLATDKLSLDRRIIGVSTKRWAPYPVGVTCACGLIGDETDQSQLIDRARTRLLNS